MFLVQKSKVGLKEYLMKGEEQHIGSLLSIPFDSPKIEEFLKEQKITADKLSPELYQQYLNQNNQHYPAKFHGRLANQWNLSEYDGKIYNDLMSNKLPDGVVLPKEIKAKKDGQIINKSENSQTGTDSVSNVPKSVSIEFARGNKETKDKIVKALNKTTEQIFEKIERQVKPSCKKGEFQDIVPGSAKLLITTFTHYENRGYQENVAINPGEEPLIYKLIRRLEPNLHTHNSIKHFAEFELYKHDIQGNRLVDKNGNYITERKMLAIDPEEVFKKQLENSANFDTLLNSNLQMEGFKTEPADELGQTFRLSGYTKELELSLSERRTEIKSFIEEQKKKGVFYSSDEQAEVEFAKSYRETTAITKELHKADEILDNVKETINSKVSKSDFDKIDEIQKGSQQKTFEPDLNKIAKSQAFETAGVVEETTIKTEIYKQVRFAKTYQSAQDLENTVNKTFNNLQSLAMGDNRIIKMADGRYTRIDIIANENALKNNIEIITSQKKHLSYADMKKGRKIIADFCKEKKKQGLNINDGQLNSFKMLLKQDPVSMAIGDAGTGKTTTTIAFANILHENLGRKVYGISVGTSTSRDLIDGNLKPENCLNTKEFLMKAYVLDRKTGKQELNIDFVKQNLNSTIIFDEAGMCGSEDMRKITDFVKEARYLGGDTQLILVGDHKQLSSVSYGNAFTNIQNQLDKDSICRLEENTRQKNDVAKAIAEGYRDKDSQKVFTALEENNLLITAKTQKNLNENLVKDYLNDQSKSKLIVCGTNAEIDNINDMVRTGLIEQEFLKPKEEQKLDFDKSEEIKVVRKSGLQTLERNRSFCPGEEIVFLQNSNKNQKKAGFEVSNSDRGIIKSINKIDDNNCKLVVDIKGKEVEFETKDYNTFNHCYAVSTHKSQGKTVENVYHLGNANQAKAQNSYVNGSRHKEQYKLYLMEDQVEKYKLNCVKEAVKETTLNDSNCQKALEEYVFHKVYEERKELKPMPEFKQKTVNKEEQLDIAMNLSNALSQQSKAEFEQKLEQKRIFESHAKAEQEKVRLLKEKEESEKLAEQQKLASLTAERMKEFNQDYGKFQPNSKPETQKEKIELDFYNQVKNTYIQNGKSLRFTPELYETRLKEKINKQIDLEVEMIKEKMKIEGKPFDKDFAYMAVDKHYNTAKNEYSIEDLYSRTQRELLAKQLSLELTSKNLPYDRLVNSVKIQVSENGMLLKLDIGERFKNNKEIVLEAIKQNPNAEKFIGNDLKKEIEEQKKPNQSTTDYLKSKIEDEKLQKQFSVEPKEEITQRRGIKLR